MINIFHFAEHEYFFLARGDLFLALEVVASSSTAAGDQLYAFRICREGSTSSGRYSRLRHG
jgi:hypothetical protein